MNDHEPATLTHDEVVEFRALKADLREMIDAWKSARGMLAFIKLLGSIAVALAAVWAFLKTGVVKP